MRQLIGFIIIALGVYLFVKDNTLLGIISLFIGGGFINGFQMPSFSDFSNGEGGSDGSGGCDGGGCGGGGD